MASSDLSSVGSSSSIKIQISNGTDSKIKKYSNKNDYFKDSTKQNTTLSIENANIEDVYTTDLSEDFNVLSYKQNDTCSSDSEIDNQDNIKQTNKDKSRTNLIDIPIKINTHRAKKILAGIKNDEPELAVYMGYIDKLKNKIKDAVRKNKKDDNQNVNFIRKIINFIFKENVKKENLREAFEIIKKDYDSIGNEHNLGLQANNLMSLSACINISKLIHSKQESKLVIGLNKLNKCFFEYRVGKKVIYKSEEIDENTKFLVKKLVDNNNCIINNIENNDIMKLYKDVKANIGLAREKENNDIINRYSQLLTKNPCNKKARSIFLKRKKFIQTKDQYIDFLNKVKSSNIDKNIFIVKKLIDQRNKMICKTIKDIGDIYIKNDNNKDEKIMEKYMELEKFYTKDPFHVNWEKIDKICLETAIVPQFDKDGMAISNAQNIFFPIEESIDVAKNAANEIIEDGRITIIKNLDCDETDFYIDNKYKLDKRLISVRADEEVRICLKEIIKNLCEDGLSEIDKQEFHTTRIYKFSTVNPGIIAKKLGFEGIEEILTLFKEDGNPINYIKYALSESEAINKLCLSRAKKHLGLGLEETAAEKFYFDKNYRWQN